MYGSTAPTLLSNWRHKCRVGTRSYTLATDTMGMRHSGDGVGVGMGVGVWVPEIKLKLVMGGPILVKNEWGCKSGGCVK